MESHCVLNDVPIKNCSRCYALNKTFQEIWIRSVAYTYTMQLQVLRCTIGFSAGNHNSTDLRSWTMPFNIICSSTFNKLNTIKRQSCDQLYKLFEASITKEIIWMENYLWTGLISGDDDSDTGIGAGTCQYKLVIRKIKFN